MGAELNAVDAYRLWTIEEQAAGRVATRMPSGQWKGELASRTKAPPYVYTLAPFWLRSADRLQRLQDGTLQTLVTVETVAENTAQTILRLPQTVAREAFGIPEWLFPWLVVGGGAWALSAFLPRRP